MPMRLSNHLPTCLKVGRPQVIKQFVNTSHFVSLVKTILIISTSFYIITYKLHISVWSNLHDYP